MSQSNQQNWQGGQTGRSAQGWPYYGNVPPEGAWWSESGRSDLGNYQPYVRVPDGGWYGPYGYGGYGQGNPPGYVPGS